jgi:hypothetical protein
MRASRILGIVLVALVGILVRDGAAYVPCRLGFPPGDGIWFFRITRSTS